MCSKTIWFLIRSRSEHFNSSSLCLITFAINKLRKKSVSLSLTLLCTELASDIQAKGETPSSVPAASSHTPLAVTTVVLVAAVLTVGGFLWKRKLQDPIPYQKI